MPKHSKRRRSRSSSSDRDVIAKLRRLQRRLDDLEGNFRPARDSASSRASMSRDYDLRDSQTPGAVDSVVDPGDYLCPQVDTEVSLLEDLPVNSSKY